MEEICRLCCSTHFVNNYIFDEENALFLKMSLYLPIKVFKNDRLPQKICDKCSCKVNDFYQFCNETIEVQNRLKSIVTTSKLIVNDRIDFTIIKQNVNSPPHLHTCNRGTQTEQQESIISAPKIKTEPKTLSPEIKKECDYFEIDDFTHIDMHSGDSDEEFLIDIKKKKRSQKETNVTSNGFIKNKRGRRKTKHGDQDMGSQPIDNGLTAISEESGVDLDLVKEEIEMRPQELGKVLDSIQGLQPVSDGELFYCCICFAQCSSKPALVKHYKEHSRAALPPPAAPAPPPPPPGERARCPRCQKVVPPPQWSEHWRRHFSRDTYPLRCAVCEVTYRDHSRILKHGLTHPAHELRREQSAQAGAPRFLCDVCPEGFIYMRCLLAHRTRAHPEAAARALSLRCGVCSRSFAHSNSLRRHARMHSGELNNLCNVCGKVLSSREHLKFHIRIHTGYKPNVCKVCGKGFVKKCNLKLHERVHSGEKPHVCSHCGKAFSQRSTLVIHERYHSGARPYACAQCGRGFVARGLLTMHLKTACGDAPRQRPPPPRAAKLSSR